MMDAVGRSVSDDMAKGRKADRAAQAVEWVVKADSGHLDPNYLLFPPFSSSFLPPSAKRLTWSSFCLSAH